MPDKFSAGVKVMSQNVQLHLTCVNQAEADKIAKSLLAKRLVACVWQTPVISNYRWQGKLEKTAEILLVMESREDLFDKVETEVAKLHSYDTFVLSSTPITRASQKAVQWWKENLKDESD